MHTTIRRNLAGAAILATMLTACGSSSTSPSAVTTTRSIAPVSPVAPSTAGASSDVQTASVSSSASSGTPTVSSSASAYDPALVAEAEKVFREYQAAFIKWQQRGGSATLPDDIAGITGDPLRGQAAKLLADQAKSQWRLGSPAPSVHVYGATYTDLPPQALVGIHACVDGTRTPAYLHGKNIGTGEALEYYGYFTYRGATLLYFMTEHRQVTRCEG